MTDDPENPAPAPHHHHHGEDAHSRTVMSRLRNYFFAGLLVTAPISITFYIVWQFVKFVDGEVTPLIPDPYNPERWGVPGVGLLIVVVALTLIGALTAGFVGRVLVRTSESLLVRMPVIRSIYGAIKQIFETVLAKKSSAFREVALIEYPRRGIWTVAFISGTPTAEIQEVAGETMVSLYVPTTPNPTSGFLLFLPERDVHRLAMSVEEGFKLVISTGIIAPPDRRPAPRPAAEVNPTAGS